MTRRVEEFKKELREIQLNTARSRAAKAQTADKLAVNSEIKTKEFVLVTDQVAAQSSTGTQTAENGVRLPENFDLREFNLTRFNINEVMDSELQQPGFADNNQSN